MNLMHTYKKEGENYRLKHDTRRICSIMLLGLLHTAELKTLHFYLIYKNSIQRINCVSSYNKIRIKIPSLYTIYR